MSHFHTHTVMDRNIGIPALLSDNAPLLPENCCNDKCFGIHIFCLHWNNTKNQRKNAQSDLIPHKTLKMDRTKLLAPLTSYLVAQALEKNWNQLLPVTMNECLTTLYWNFGPLFANCSRSLTFEGCLLPTAVLRSCHRCAMGLRSAPRMILASPGKFWQTLVWLFYVSVSAVGTSLVSYHSIPFHSNGDG